MSPFQHRTKNSSFSDFPESWIVSVLGLLAIGVSLLPTGSEAQIGPPDLSADVVNNRIALGESGQYIINIINGGQEEPPPVIEAPGLTIQSSGKQFTRELRNGAVASKQTYFYRITAEQPGEYTIPRLEMAIRGKTFTTAPINVAVYERTTPDVSTEATKPYFGKLEVSKQDFYVNEIIPFSLTAYVRGKNSISEIVNPVLDTESFVFKGFRQVRRDSAAFGDKPFSVAVIPSTFFALKEGDHRIGPATIGVRIVDSSSSFGLAAFFQQVVSRELSTNSVNVTVKPLPPGAPRSFTGGVGKFDLVATPSTTSVNVGDPISMEFEVTGVGNLRTMSAPVFEVPQKGIWKSYDPAKTLNDEEDSDGFKEGRVTFRQVIIPEAKVAEIPSFELTFFDPATEEYVTRKTIPVPLTVTNDESNTAPTAIQFSPTSSADSTGFSAAKRPKPKFDDVLHIVTGNPRWIAASAVGEKSVLFLLTQVLFSIAFFTVLGFGMMRAAKRWRDNRAPVDRELTFNQSLKKIPSAGASKREFFQAVAYSLERWKSEHPEAPDAVADVIDRVSERCGSVLYSGAADPDEAVYPAEVAEFRSILEKLPRR